MTSAQVYAQITELARRVQEWEEKIIPRLREEVSPYFLLQVVMYSYKGKWGLRWQCSNSCLPPLRSGFGSRPYLKWGSSQTGVYSTEP